MSDTGITSAHLKDLAAALAKNTALQKLLYDGDQFNGCIQLMLLCSLGNNLINDEGVVALAEVLPINTTLNELAFALP